jgi:ferrochelatase
VQQPYDAILVVSFGGPEKRDEVIPFLENVLRGRGVPRERMLAVAEHYYHFGGISPINAQTRELIEMLRRELAGAGIDLPVYWGNRNWHPLLPDTVRAMQAAGVRRALAWVASAYGSYSGCRQYLENIEAARAAAGTGAPEIDKIRLFFNHPGFIEATAERVAQALHGVPESQRPATPVLYTAHSIPVAMAAGCPYVEQLQETCRLVSVQLGHDRWRLVYQSRSGPPRQPWLEPDVGEAIRQLHAEGCLPHVVVAPIGFLSDHLEVLYDLDVEARRLCDQLGVTMLRAGTVGTHPRFVRAIRELIAERLGGGPARAALGTLGPSPEACAPICCQPIPSRPGPSLA